MTPTGFVRLRAEALSVHRGGRPLIQGQSWTLNAGDVLLLQGPNGAGKSSLLRALMGLTPRAGGQIYLEEGSATLTPPHLAAWALYQGHALGLKGALSPLENLYWSASLDGSLPPDARPFDAALHAALQRVGLGRHGQRETRLLSQGQRQRLQLARFALARQQAGRALWLMDEPSAALDQAGTTLLQTLLSEHAHAGGAAIVATHWPIHPPGVTPRVLSVGAAPAGVP